VHPKLPTAICKLLHVNGIVEIPRVIGIDRDDELVAQIFASGDLLRINILRNALSLL
jgi:hypothetical protein